MNGLTGKIAVITGGTQGLGAAIARLFADRGASGIVTCGRSVAKGQAKAREIQDATGAKVEVVETAQGAILRQDTLAASTPLVFHAVAVRPHARTPPW